MPGDKIIVRADPDLKDLIPGFLQNRRRDTEAIRDAMARDDMERVRFIGHMMKGSGGGYGFGALSDFGTALEAGAKDLDPQAIGRVVALIENYLDGIDVVYE